MKKFLLTALLSCSSLIVNASSKDINTLPRKITGNNFFTTLICGPCFPNVKEADSKRCVVGPSLVLQPCPIPFPGSTPPYLTMPTGPLTNPSRPRIGGTFWA